MLRSAYFCSKTGEQSQHIIKYVLSKYAYFVHIYLKYAKFSIKYAILVVYSKFC